MYLIRIALLASAFAGAQVTAAGIDVGAMTEYLAPHKSTLLKRVRNIGDNTAFVKIELKEMLFAANGKDYTEQDVAAVVHDKNAQKNTLIASPARMIIAANGTQTTRLLHLGKRDKEHYYRVRFLPVLPDREQGFVLSDEDSKQLAETIAAGVSVLTGYGAVLIVPPDVVRHHTVLSETAADYTIRNDGNSVIMVENFYDCVSTTDNCQGPSAFHVLPTRSHVIPKQSGHTYRFELVEGKHKRLIKF
ncbi:MULTISPECIES: hypothetical protein [unclassified Undibacterium]|uniref:hypothetical protein n=2 Tax=Pseudomonadota TaxID=1224 RepID=UPI002AC8A2E3|nr:MULTISPECIES: hypothetical protein [unclassified Undibacterium]MEB0140867.1 hypothetical protein [Undibacterium sp. CCC2.1]MEB0173821.1 hypothetical protein [Undibacterium sp. CCC1.1]MEB0216702.1 hypothetical protein [Undibacterium sp. 5I2]WPX44384.1 hypothetical protein RHM61_03890 [Undibacterium sp. CCC3.4]